MILLIVLIDQKARGQKDHGKKVWNKKSWGKCPDSVFIV